MLEQQNIIGKSACYVNNVISIVQHEIESPQQDDLQSIAALVNRCWHETYDDYLPESICNERTEKAFVQQLSPVIDRAHIVRKAGSIVGFATNVSNCIDHLWVDYKFRRTGIGSELLKAQCALLEQAGFESVQAGCESFNGAALAFYKKHQWRVLDESTETIEPGLNVGVVVFGMLFG